jgi:hypothetical protein
VTYACASAAETLPLTLFSRRRSRPRSGPSRSQTAIPDWVWGAGLGGIVLIGIVIFVLFTGVVGGGGGNICDKPLTPIPNVETRDPDAAGFQQEWVDLNHLISDIQQSNFDAANSLFYGSPTHNFMHTAEPAIREKNETLGKNLCNAVIQFENDFDSPTPAKASVLVTDVTRVRDYMADGAVALGLPRPSG